MARSPTQTQATAEASRRATSGPSGSQPRTEARRLEAVIHSGAVGAQQGLPLAFLGQGGGLAPAQVPGGGGQVPGPPGPGRVAGGPGRGVRGHRAPTRPGPGVRSCGTGRILLSGRCRPMRSGGWACRAPGPAAVRGATRPPARSQRVQGCPLATQSRSRRGNQSRAPACQGTMTRAPGEVLAVVPELLLPGGPAPGRRRQALLVPGGQGGRGRSPSTGRVVSSRPRLGPGRAQAQEHRLAVPAEPAPGAAVGGPEHPAFGDLQQPGLETPGSEHEGHQEVVALGRVQRGPRRSGASNR